MMNYFNGEKNNMTIVCSEIENSTGLFMID
jgi:hypothetical protein